MLNDITTDLEDPPQFILQKNGPADFDPATAQEHASRYGSLRSLDLKTPYGQLFDKALQLVQTEGWQVVASDALRGQIEAVATTRLLRFKDDIVIRLRGEGDPVRVDMRSKSRVGKSDLGANARRIRSFLKALAAGASGPD